jgi:hypothetical protein
VYNNRQPVESAVRGGYGAPTPAPAPAQYSMSPMHPPAPPHAAHPQAYPMHGAAAAPPHPSVTPMRHNPYGPPPHPHAPHPHHAYSYATYAAPPPPAPEWASQGFVANHQHGGWDAYAHHSQHLQQQGHAPVGQPHPQTPVPAGAMDHGGHRIQLAPIPENNATNGSSVSPTVQHSPVRSSNPSPPSMRSNGRVSMSNSVGERMDNGVHGYQNRGQIQGKKNPLSIGSIISNDAR